MGLRQASFVVTKRGNAWFLWDDVIDFLNNFPHWPGSEIHQAEAWVGGNWSSLPCVEPSLRGAGTGGESRRTLG